MKFLLIGAGMGQVHIARKIKQRGHYLVVIAFNSIEAVTSIADKFIHHDLYDYKGVLDIAKKEGVEAVISDQHDIMAPLVAFIAENLGLPGNRYATLKSCCDKNIFRDNCDILGIPCPKHIKLTSASIPESFSRNPFPWIVKPSDSQSSVGVKRVNNPEECESAILNALQLSRTNTAIIEEFFCGKEIVAEGFIWKGVYYNIGFADRRYFDLDNIFIPSQTIFPSIAPPYILEQIRQYEKAMADYLKPEFAIVHSEYLYNPASGEVRVVESGLRGGGVYISSHLIPLYCGIDINEMLIDAAEGKKVDMGVILSNRQEMSSAYICCRLDMGIVSSLEGLKELKAQPSVKMVDIKIKPGDFVDKMQHKGQRIGPILLQAKNRAEIDNCIATVQDCLKISTIDETGSTHDAVWA